MKKSLLTLVLCAALVSACMAYGTAGGPVAAGQEGRGRADIDIGFFYNYLSPFGSWVDFSPWGYVWCPAGFGFGWNPYADGEWLWTDDGWFWDSAYDWGWAPFHYGRWGFDDDLGWFWVPGITWGPAWVTWCWNDSFIGWAPIPPGIEFEVGIGFSAFPEIPFRDWCFVDGRHFLDRDLDRSIIPFERNRGILSNVSERGNISFEGGRIFNGGLRVDDVRRWTGRNVTTFRVESGDRPGRMVGANSVRVYRPSVTRNEGARPQTFMRRDEAVKRAPEMRMNRGNQGRAPVAGERPPMSMNERHNQETQTMQQSQQRERQAMMERQKKEAAAAANEAERQRVNQDYQKKQQEMQQRHAEEQKQMSQRHQQERQQSGGGQQPPPKPPKKK